jgi:lysozyme
MLLVVVLVVAGLFHQTILWFNMPSRARFPVRGIDVSHHQGTIDWAAVASAGYRFAWIKASEGGDSRDSRFAESWEGASAAGVVPGGYHFYTFCRTPEEQAANFLGALEGRDGTALPPVVDVEYGGNCSRRPTDLAGELERFRGVVERKLGRRPLVYTTHEIRADHAIEGPFWMRDVFWEPPGPWVVWQYGYERHLPGVSGLVDVDAFAGSEAEFEGFVQRQERR